MLQTHIILSGRLKIAHRSRGVGRLPQKVQYPACKHLRVERGVLNLKIVWKCVDTKRGLKWSFSTQNVCNYGDKKTSVWNGVPVECSPLAIEKQNHALHIKSLGLGIPGPRTAHTFSQLLGTYIRSV